MRYEEAIQKHEPLTPYEKGLVAGIYRFAWQKDGTFYVGTTGSLLGDAVDRAITESRARSPEPEEKPSRESVYMIERAGQLSTAVGIARLRLSRRDPEGAAAVLDDCCDKLHDLHWQACLDDGYEAEQIESLLGPRDRKVQRSWVEGD